MTCEFVEHVYQVWSMSCGLVWDSQNDWMTCELVKFVIFCPGLLVTLLLWRQSIKIAVFKVFRVGSNAFGALQLPYGAMANGVLPLNLLATRSGRRPIDL
jgi:hypothetical protein